LCDSVLAVSCFRNNHDIFVWLEYLPKEFSHDWIIVNEQDMNHKVEILGYRTDDYESL